MKCPYCGTADAQLGFDAAIKGQTEGALYVNDLTYEAECFKAAAEYIRNARPDMIVFTGDQIHRPLDQEQWDTFNNLLALLPSDCKVCIFLATMMFLSRMVRLIRLHSLPVTAWTDSCATSENLYYRHQFQSHKV